MRLVYAGLHLEVGRTTTALEDGLGLPGRTVREAVRWLIEHGLAVRRPVLGDTRKHWILPRGEHA